MELIVSKDYHDQVSTLEIYLRDTSLCTMGGKDITTREATRRLYREFYIFLGNKDRKAWYRVFCGRALPRLARIRQERLSGFYAYLRTVEFLDYMNSVEKELN
jgi:hypothetical protein